MFIQVDFKAGKPAYVQIMDQVKYAAASGALNPGDPLPSIRALAQDLRVNRNTVVKAYDELEAQGVIKTHPGKGCRLAENATKLKKAARIELLNGAIDQLLTEAHHLQIDKDEVIRLLESRFTDLKRDLSKTNPNAIS